MPTPHGIRERLALDAYDCIFDAETDHQEDNSSVRAFGNRNIGCAALTSLQVPGYIDNHNATAHVTGVRARTSIENGRLLDELANNTIVYFNIGCMPRASADLATLLKRPSGSARPHLDKYTSADRANEDRALRDHMADEMGREITAGRRYACDFSRHELQVAADVALREIKERPLVMVVPVRQNVSVSVDFFGRANEVRRELWGRPGRIWVHLEGWISREV